MTILAPTDLLLTQCQNTLSCTATPNYPSVVMSLILHITKLDCEISIEVQPREQIPLVIRKLLGRLETFYKGRLMIYFASMLLLIFSDLGIRLSLMKCHPLSAASLQEHNKHTIKMEEQSRTAAESGG